MKIRTVYFKVLDMQKSLAFWGGFLGFEPHKKSPYWSEFKCSNINLGFLWDEDLKVSPATFVPVFEFTAEELPLKKDLALRHGASVVLDIKDHPDQKSYVLKDSVGNEFEITRFHD